MIKIPKKVRIQTNGEGIRFIDDGLELTLPGHKKITVVPRQKIEDIINSVRGEDNSESVDTVKKYLSRPQGVFRTDLDGHHDFKKLKESDFKEQFIQVERYLKDTLAKDDSLSNLLAQYLRVEECHDYTNKLSHSLRVAVISGIIGTQFDGDIVKDAVLGGLIHDIGHLVTPPITQTINFSPKDRRRGDIAVDNATKANIKLLSTLYHPTLGYLILKKCGYSEDIASIALDHHTPDYPTEYFKRKPDGTIVLNKETQIILLVDKWDAYIKDRLYKIRRGYGEVNGESDANSYDSNSAALYLAACSLKGEKRDRLFRSAQQKKELFPDLTKLLKDERNRRGNKYADLSLVEPGVVDKFLGVLTGLGFIDEKVSQKYEKIRDYQQRL